jgi:hypothetical protein
MVFQEAQAIDMFSVPMLYLFYSDKSFSGQHLEFSRSLSRLW